MMFYGLNPVGIYGCRRDELSVDYSCDARLAQWKSTSFTRKGSQVQALQRAPFYSIRKACLANPSSSMRIQEQGGSGGRLHLERSLAETGFFPVFIRAID